MRVEKKDFSCKYELYEALAAALESLLVENGDLVANLANASAIIKLFLDDLNWAGFYLIKEGALVLGPFQGKPAVAVIEMGSGVCGTAAAELKTQIVEDVRECENHIVCDEASISEIVVPIVSNGEIFGVLDIDSPVAARFDSEDARGLEKLAAILTNKLWKRRS